MKDTLIVISYYDRRPLHNLVELLRSLHKYPAGDEFDICLVVNRTKDEAVILPNEFSSITVRYRHNLGMNIGAWDYGWRNNPGCKVYVFLQDECYIIRENWLSEYLSLFKNPDCGMVGESINAFWNRPWAELRELFAHSQLPEHMLDAKPVNRIDFYLQFLADHGVWPGKSGRHLRSVVWVLPGDVLKRIDGFLIGRNYGECIGAEIATSKKVEALGRQIVQANSEEEFFYIRHVEYNQDFPGSGYAHNVKYIDYASVERLLDAKERELWQLAKLKWHRRFGFLREK
jgi:hypothetical protein